MFLFDVELGDLDQTIAGSLEERCAAPDHWPLRVLPARTERRWFGLAKAYPATVDLSVEAGGRSAVESSPSRDEDTLHFAPGVPERLNRTLERLAEVAGQDGFAFRATYADLPVDTEHSVTLAQLVDLVRGDQLRTRTRYLVRFT